MGNRVAASLFTPHTAPLGLLWHLLLQAVHGHGCDSACSVHRTQPLTEIKPNPDHGISCAIMLVLLQGLNKWLASREKTEALCMQSKLGVSGDIGAAAAFSFRAVSNLGNQAVRSVIHDQAAFSRLLVQRISFCRRSKTCGANFYESELLAIYVAYYAPTSPGKTDAAINKEERKECTHAVCVLCLMPAPAEMRFLVLHLFRCFIFCPPPPQTPPGARVRLRLQRPSHPAAYRNQTKSRPWY